MRITFLSLLLTFSVLTVRAQRGRHLESDSAALAAATQEITDSVVESNDTTDSVSQEEVKNYPSVDSMQKEYLDQQQSVHAFSKEEWDKATKDLDYSDKRPKPKDKHAKKTSSQEKSEQSNPAPLSQLISIAVLVVVLAALLLFLLNYFGVKLSLGKKNKETLSSRQDNDQVPETELERMLREALAQKNFREAVRIYYLMIIQEFSDRKWITWRKEKTNADYLYELKEPQHRGNFRKITVIYERAWYGDHDLDEKNFALASEQMKNFISVIKRKS